jgi:hypothetical protein
MRIITLLPFLLVAGCSAPTITACKIIEAKINPAPAPAAAVPAVVPKELRECAIPPDVPVQPRTIESIGLWANAIEKAGRDCAEKHRKLLVWISENMR